MAKITKTVAAEPADKTLELKALLIKKIPATFDREPTSGFNPNLDVLVKEIINLLS